MALTKVNNDLQDALAAAQPTITSVGTLTGFTSTGIDDNATSTAITITSDEKVGIGINQPTEMLEIYNTSSPAIQLNDGGDYKSIMRLAGNDLEIRGSSGSLEFYTGSADGDSSTQRLTIDSGGNVGIGVTPAAFNAASTAVQLSGGHFYDRTIGETYIGNNIYHDSGDVTRAVNTGLASNIGFYSGNTIFQSAASVAAGALSTMVTNMKIDASGRVTMPSQPAFDVHHSGGSYASGTTVTSLDLNTVRLNRGNHYSASNDRFIAPVAGVYVFYYRAIISGTYTNLHIRFRKNGAHIAGGDTHASPTTSGWSQMSSQILLQLAVNDYVQVEHTTNTNIYGDSYQTFQGHLLG